MTVQPAPVAESLRHLCGGAVHLPGDPGYDVARLPWNVAVDQRPAAVAYPASAEEVAEIVRAAAAHGLRVAPQGTGHNAGALAGHRSPSSGTTSDTGLSDVVLLRTSAMRDVTVDPETRIARVGAGTLWIDVVDAVAPHGLAALHGSSPDVGVVGYTLGGGMGWYARALGLAANSVTAAEIVTADGRLLRVDPTHDSDLFWAVRGGGGNVGIVTALEFRLYPIDTAYAGMLVWDRVHAAAVLSAWARWTETAPDNVTTAFRVLQLPPIEAIPAPVRGRQIVMINGAVLSDDDTAADLLAGLRALEPEIDTFARVPSASLVRLHMDPEGPTPGVSATSTLTSLPEEAQAAFLATVGPGSHQTLLSAELRQLGGALGRPAPDAGALPALAGEFVLFGVAIAATPEMGAAGQADADALVDAMSPWAHHRQYLNFVEQATDTASGYEPEAFERLLAVRERLDPVGTIVANHAV